MVRQQKQNVKNKINENKTLKIDVSREHAGSVTGAPSRLRKRFCSCGMDGAPSVAAGQPKPFLSKLYKMVDEEETDHIVSWTQTGEALIVLDPEAFAQQLLPLHFKHNNFSSFVRQLNTYGFSKVMATAAAAASRTASLHSIAPLTGPPRLATGGSGLVDIRARAFPPGLVRRAHPDPAEELTPDHKSPQDRCVLSTCRGIRRHCCSNRHFSQKILGPALGPRTLEIARILSRK
jgi:hypothetical protein